MTTKERKVALEEARELSQQPNYTIHWRPKPELPEDEQYATVVNNG